jgi:DUF4097 and DUF4098 domain-containing protein YvlB
MIRTTLALLLTVGLVAPALADDGDIDKVNGGIQVAEGGTAGKLSTVNGGIHVGANAHARSAETVNGGIDVGAGAVLDSLETVNGGVKLGSGARVGGGVTAVNGSITLESNADVAGKLSNVNGGIKLNGAHAGGGVETANGDITLGANSRVEGGILIDEDHSFMHWGTPHKPRIVIGPHSTVQGKLTFKREVELFVSDSATIGAVEGASVQTFSGDQPAQ